jgi:hypothetical protein
MTEAKLPDKPRRHRWVTEALDAGDSKLSVWPSEDDFKSKVKQQRFLDTITKVGNDPRVVTINRHDHEEHGVVYVFDLVE